MALGWHNWVAFATDRPVCLSQSPSRLASHRHIAQLRAIVCSHLKALAIGQTEL